MAASVPLSKESPFTNTLCVFLMAQVLMYLNSWINFAWLASSGSCLLLMYSSFSIPRALYLFRRCTLGEGGRRIFLLSHAETRVQSPSSHRLFGSVSLRMNSGFVSPCTALRQGCYSAWDSVQYHVSISHSFHRYCTAC